MTSHHTSITESCSGTSCISLKFCELHCLCCVNLPSHVSETEPCQKRNSGAGFHHREQTEGSIYKNLLSSSLGCNSCTTVVLDNFNFENFVRVHAGSFETLFSCAWYPRNYQRSMSKCSY